MKVFIVFIALCIIAYSGLSHQLGINRYTLASEHIKAMAEDAAAGASLYFDREAYADGRMIYDRESGDKLAACIFEGIDASSKVEYHDEADGIPFVTVKVVYLFEGKEIKREAIYELL